MLRRLHHLAFRTHRLAALEAFYVELLGLSVVRRDAERSVWLSMGDSVLMLERADGGEPELRPDTLELVAFAVAEEEKAIVERTLMKRAIPIEARTAFTLYFRDPDGRRIGVSSYPLPELRGQVDLQ
jgi:catechol-2,3-dioxygenase